MAAWGFSNFAFAISLPTERIEAILAGMVAAFEFFGCVAKEAWWDNPEDCGRGHPARPGPADEHRVYAALASHYAFEPLFCMPRTATEKPDVEHKVYDLQRRWCTPVPKVQDHDELNAHLLRCCLADLDRTCAGQTQTIGWRFAMDKAAALALPTACLRCLHPRAQAGRQVSDGRLRLQSLQRASALGLPGGHRQGLRGPRRDRRRAPECGPAPRSYGRSQQVLDPLHYLVTLGRRPGALDHSGVYRNWQLPAALHGIADRPGRPPWPPMPAAGSTSACCNCLAEHPAGRVAAGDRAAAARGDLLDAESDPRPSRPSGRALGTSAGDRPMTPVRTSSIRADPGPRPDLSRFNQLLSIGEPGHA